MSSHFRKKRTIWITGIALLAIVLITILVFNTNTPVKRQYPPEKKRLSEIFGTLDTIYWKNREKSLLLSQEAIHISRKIGDSNALAEALFNHARTLQNLEMADSSFLVSNQALAIAEKMKNDNLIAMIKNIIGIYYYTYRDNYYLALSYFTEVEKIGSKIQSDPIKGMAANGLGLVHLRLISYDKAIVFFHLTADLCLKTDDIKHAAGAFVNLCVCYLEKDSLSMALFYQEKALRMFLEIQDTLSICKSYLNLWLINSRLRNNALSSEYLNQALNYSKQIDNRETLGLVYQNLGAFYLQNNQLNQAEDYFSKSLDIFSENAFKSYEMSADLALSNVEEKLGKWPTAYQYYRRGIELKDSIMNFETQKKINDFQWEIESQKKRYEKELLQKKYEIQQKKILILTITMISVIIIVLLLSIYLKKFIKSKELQNAYLKEKIETDKKINTLERLRYQAEIEAKNKELATSSIQVVTKNDILLTIEGLAEKSFKNKQMDNITYNDLKKILKENMNMDKDWEQFKQTFEQVHQDFFNKLRKICPSITNNEMRLCAYLKINLQTKEIAKILSVTPATVETIRYRFRKKLHLDKGTNLENYIREI